MESKQVVVFDGIKYRKRVKEGGGAYFIADEKDVKERCLHRAVHTKHYGGIPKGHHIHHKNFDAEDNRIENLECLSATEHLQLHMRKRFDDPEFRAKNAATLDSIRPLAGKWHGSPEGIEWHREHGKRVWKKRERVKAVCSVCGAEYRTYRPKNSRFCSRACEQREGYQRHKTAKGVCAECGKEFVFNKYRSQTCCSRKCANIRRGRETNHISKFISKRCEWCKKIYTCRRDKTEQKYCSRSCAKKAQGNGI